ncbi:hypothetical protein Patl1_33345 [Pistacia atlantica]|uniref:Uncharacterized protein n=1 Tax=Pistacia atlantica TaxID=434234 RepID=A0ACC0ZTP0_9ROSI|nr:hypothetical protein Patl1_33345 [Pistacia atlantica]
MSLWDLHGEEFYAEASLTNSVYYTHAGDDVRELSVKPLLYMIEEIFQPARPSVPGLGTQVQLNALEDDSAFQFDLNVMLAINEVYTLSLIIHYAIYLFHVFTLVLSLQSTYLHHE